MGLLGRALAGAGEGASQIASKYIDEQLAEQRAQVLADIQNKSAQTMDQYTNSDERRARMGALAAADTVAAGGAADQVALNTATNQPLTDASIMRSNAVNAGTLPTDVARTTAIGSATEATKPIKTNPGDIVFNPDGTIKVQNTRLTGAEATLQAYTEGLRGKTGQARDDYFKAASETLRDAAKEKQAAIDRFLDNNPDAMTPPKPETHFVGADTPGKPTPANIRYQQMLKEMGLIKGQQDDLFAVYKDEHPPKGGGSAAGTRGNDSLGLGLAGPGAASAMPAHAGDNRTPAEIQSDAGMRARGQAGRLQTIEEEYAAAGPAERPALERELARVRAQGGGDPIPSPAPGGIAAAAQAAALASDVGSGGNVASSKPVAQPAAAPAVPVAAAVAAPPPGSAAAALAAEPESDFGSSIWSAAKKVGGAISSAMAGSSAATTQLGAQFDADLRTMKPADFVAKYGEPDVGTRLDPQRQQMLRQLALLK